MCGIAGFYCANKILKENASYYTKLLSAMAHTLNRRGPNDCGTYLANHCGLAHTRLAIIDLVTGHQPITYQKEGRTYTIIYNGEIYNTKELRCDLRNRGYVFQTTSDAELALLGIVEYGADYVKRLNGVFAFAILDEQSDILTLYRDRLGVKPLFYTMLDDTLIFSSEIKGILAYPSVTPQIDKNGLNEIFSLGPAKTPGCGVFKGIHEVLPAHYVQISKKSLVAMEYWHLDAHPHEDSYARTLEKTRFLITDSITRQMVSDVPICTFLSGGVDSSIVSAICAASLKEKGELLNTFSFGFTDNEKYFKSNAFQPSMDTPFVDIMVDSIHSNHHYLECSKESLADLLYDSVYAHDLPAMADIDSSMLYFCSIVKDYNKVVLTGECADEIFGGYPWFHKEELFSKDTFPWTTDLRPRSSLLSSEFAEFLQMEDYVANAYSSSLAEAPVLPYETPLEKRRREISYLNMKWFMQTLLDRTDRTSMYSGLEARVPFADHRIVEYLFNIPWEWKAKDGIVKNLLRTSCKGLVPDSILFRKKSPYPKTYDPNYEKLLANRLLDVLEDSNAPILSFLDKKKVLSFLSTPSDYVTPWYGQLMAEPQMIAYLLQINFWLKEYKVEVIS